MKDANITTSVDVKLGHADMIEMLVEEQKEILETKIANKRGELSKLGVEETELKQKIEKAYIKDLKLDQRKEIKPLMEAAKILKLTVESDVHVRWARDEKPFDSIPYVDLMNIGSKRNAMEQYKEAMAQSEADKSRQRGYYHMIVDSIDATFVARSYKKDPQYGDKVTDITLQKKGQKIRTFKPSATTKKLIAKLEDLTVKQALVDKEIFQLNCNLFELEKSGSRHKAKFMKAMLKNSETGQQLLGIMSKVGGTNLLEAGQDSPE